MKYLTNEKCKKILMKHKSVGTRKLEKVAKNGIKNILVV